MSTTAPDDQDWLQLAEEAFGDDPPTSEAAPQADPALLHWRYRAPSN